MSRREKRYDDHPAVKEVERAKRDHGHQEKRWSSATYFVPEAKRDLAFAKDEVIVLSLFVDLAHLIDRLPEVQAHRWADDIRQSRDIDGIHEVLSLMSQQWSSDEMKPLWNCFYRHRRRIK